MQQNNNEGCGNNPIIVFLGVVAALIAIYAFLTGNPTLRDALGQNSPQVRTGNNSPQAAVPTTYSPPTYEPPTRVPPATAPATQVPIVVTGLFGNLWRGYSSELGSPVSGNESDRAFAGAEMPFDGGHMFSATFPYKRIWVVIGSRTGAWTGSGSWRDYVDTWRDGDPDFSCPKEAEYPKQPIRGFGRVWCNNSDVRRALGWGLSPEKWVDEESPGTGIQRYQEFERGFIFRDSDGWRNALAYVFFKNGKFVRQSYR